MGVSINKLSDCNIYVNGNNMLGRAQEVDAPKPMAKMIEYKALGLLGAFELPSGFDKMDMRIKWNSFYEDVFQNFADPYQPVKLQIRSSLETWEGGARTAEKACVIYATCSPKGFPLGNFKPQDPTEIESTLSCTHCKMEVDGVEVMEIDFMNNIFKVNGEDRMATYRANIGA